MNYLHIDRGILKIIKELFPTHEVVDHIYRIRQGNRYIQINTPINNSYIHYEYYRGHIELHFEGDESDTQYQDLIDFLQQETENDNCYLWEDRGWVYCCQLTTFIHNCEELKKSLKEFIEHFDKLIYDYSKQSFSTRIRLEQNDSFGNQENTVEIKNLTLKEVLQLPLSIPPYQRIYCWEENNVNTLLDDLFSHYDNKNVSCTYRMGTIILHRHNGSYDILDGQQRLITLSLLLNELGVVPLLLQQEFISETSLKYIAYNKFLIQSFCKKNRRKSQKIAEFLLNHIDFSVLALQNSSIDLAYTFFSNQNSRGVQLTDYDLLKAHHLRYIPQGLDLQAKRYAETWNKMIEDSRSSTNKSECHPYENNADYINILDTYLYRLRKWSRKHSCEDDSVEYRIKKEYESAPVIDEIAPFGETFNFSEPIQGGAHFFSFVEHHRRKYHQFVKNNEYIILHSIMEDGTNRWYRDVIEALLFGYYLKFGNDFLTDSLAAIMRIILQHRYEKGKTSKSSIDQWVKDSEIIMMINQATSPTFFLAEARQVARNQNYPLMQKMSPIQKRMKRKACEITRLLENQFNIDSFKILNK